MRFLFFLLIAFPVYVFSSDYSWTAVGYEAAGTFSSPNSACVAAISISGAAYTINRLVQSGADSYICVLNVPGTSNTRNLTIQRSGDSCPAASVYNSASGSCDPTNKCAILANTAVPAYRWPSSTDSPQPTIVINGCEATTGGVTLCKNDTKGSYVCTGTATLTGKQGDTSISPASTCTGDSCLSGAPQPSTSNKDCVYAGNGSGAATCTATHSESNPGTTSCGSVNGAWTCVENPKSTSTDSTLSSTKASSSNTDGTVTTTTNDDLGVTTCNGVKNCQSTSSTSTSITVTDSNGNVVSSTGSCKGSNCSATGSTNGASDGSNTGDDDKDSGGAAVSTLTDPSDGTFDGEGDKWDAKIEQAKTDIKSDLDKLKGAFQPIGAISLSGSAHLYCPAPISIMGKSISFCLDDYAASLNWISLAVYALCAITALFIVFA